jgi:predicted O-linked N-acetylglucosamine transferase (SPINDLY family)
MATTKKTTIKKAPATKPAPPDVPANAETDVEASGSMGLLLALLKAAGVTLTAQQAAALTATDTQHKTDVNVPEMMTSLNGLVLSNAATHCKNVDAINLNTVKANQEYNATNSQMQLDHRDQNHDRAININETDAYAVLSIAAAYERLRNPTPEK